MSVLKIAQHSNNPDLEGLCDAADCGFANIPLWIEEGGLPFRRQYKLCGFVAAGPDRVLLSVQSLSTGNTVGDPVTFTGPYDYVKKGGTELRGHAVLGIIFPDVWSGLPKSDQHPA